MNEMFQEDSKRGGLFSTILKKIAEIERFVRDHKSIQHAIDTVNPATNYILVCDEKPNGNDGGTSVPHAWTTREINTEVSDPGNYCSISANQIKLDAGTYICSIISPFYDVYECSIRLWNVTDSLTELLGMSNQISAGGKAFLNRKFTIATQKIFEIQYIADVEVLDIGLGTSIGNVIPEYTDVEIFTVAEFWKVA